MVKPRLIVGSTGDGRRTGSKCRWVSGWDLHKLGLRIPLTIFLAVLVPCSGDVMKEEKGVLQTLVSLPAFVQAR